VKDKGGEKRGDRERGEKKLRKEKRTNGWEVKRKGGFFELKNGTGHVCAGRNKKSQVDRIRAEEGQTTESLENTSSSGRRRREGF